MSLAPLLLALLAGLPKPGERPAPDPAWILCTEDTIEVQSKDAQGKKGPQKVDNPIAAALAKAKPGTTVWLDPGNYPAFTIGFQSNSPANAATSGGEPGNPVVVQGKGPGVRILGEQGDTIAIDQKVPNGWITFRNLEIVPGQRSGVLFFQRGDGRLHQGYTFEDCSILGAFDFATGQGKHTKWGVWGENLADFRFAGVQAPARIENISDEHAFYLLNVQGSITIENVQARDLGRTFCQFTARASEGAPGKGDVIVRNCTVEDACMAQGDGFKGGSAFTICGRNTCTFLFEKDVYKAGFRKERLRCTLPGAPYGTGAFAAWEESKSGANGTLILRDNDFSFAKDCGDRPVVAIGGCRKVLIVGENHFQSGGTQPALALDPVNLQGRPVSVANGSVYLAPKTKLEGTIEYLGKEPSAEQLQQLKREPGEDPPPPGGG